METGVSMNVLKEMAHIPLGEVMRAAIDAMEFWGAKDGLTEKEWVSRAAGCHDRLTDWLNQDDGIDAEKLYAMGLAIISHLGNGVETGGILVEFDGKEVVID